MICTVLTVVVLLALTVPDTVDAAVSSTWAKSFGTTKDDSGKCVIGVSDGYLVAGIMNSSSDGFPDQYVLKVSPTGNVLWSRNFGGGSLEYSSAAITVSGGYLIAGYNDTNFELTKIDASGNRIWAHQYGGPRLEQVSDLITVSDGYLVFGTTNSYGAGNNDFFLVKTDFNGAEQWNKSYGGVEIEFGESVVPVSDGLMLFGTTYSYGQGGRDLFLVKTNAQGVKQWQKTYGGPVDDFGTDAVHVADGLLLVGGTESYGNGSMDVFLVKTNSYGTEMWKKTYGGTASEYGLSLMSVAVAGEDSVVIAGLTFSYGAGGSDVYVVKTDKYGDLIRDRAYGKADDDAGYSIIRASDGDYVIAGKTEVAGRMDDVYLLKVSPSSFAPAATLSPSSTPTPAPAPSLPGTVTPTSEPAGTPDPTSEPGTGADTVPTDSPGSGPTTAPVATPAGEPGITASPAPGATAGTPSATPASQGGDSGFSLSSVLIIVLLSVVLTLLVVLIVVFLVRPK